MFPATTVAVQVPVHVPTQVPLKAVVAKWQKEQDCKGKKARREKGKKEKSRILLTRPSHGYRHHRGGASTGASTSASAIESRCCIMSLRDLQRREKASNILGDFIFNDRN